MRSCVKPRSSDWTLVGIKLSQNRHHSSRALTTRDSAPSDSRANGPAHRTGPFYVRMDFVSRETHRLHFAKRHSRNGRRRRIVCLSDGVRESSRSATQYTVRGLSECRSQRSILPILYRWFRRHRRTSQRDGQRSWWREAFWPRSFGSERQRCFSEWWSAGFRPPHIRTYLAYSFFSLQCAVERRRYCFASAVNRLGVAA
jgi:hypothetical protein